MFSRMLALTLSYISCELATKRNISSKVNLCTHAHTPTMECQRACECVYPVYRFTSKQGYWLITSVRFDASYAADAKVHNAHTDSTTCDFKWQNILTNVYHGRHESEVRAICCVGRRAMRIIVVLSVHYSFCTLLWLLPVEGVSMCASVRARYRYVIRKMSEQIEAKEFFSILQWQRRRWTTLNSHQSEMY